MTNDKLTLQQRQTCIRRVGDLLRRIEPPQKTDAQWSVLESGLFTHLGADARQSREYSLYSPFLRPLSFAAGFAVIALGIAVSFLVKSPDDSPSSYARLLSVHGSVLVGLTGKKCADTLGGAGGVHGAFHFKKGMSVTTLANGTFIARLDKGSAIEVSPRSQLTFLSIDKKQIAINLTRGSILAKVSKRSADQKFSVVTPSATCVVVGTIFKVDVEAPKHDSANSTALTVYEGKVRFIENGVNSKQPRIVATGQRSISGTSMGPVGSITESQTPLKNISTLELLVGPQSLGPEISGLVDVSSQPEGAAVLLDNTVVGKTPLLLRKPVGIHTISVSAQGYATSEKSLRIDRDSTSDLTVCLVKTAPACRVAAAAAKSIAPIRLSPIAPESTLVAIPEYVEAMIQCTIGEYQKSLSILESLKNSKPIDLKSKISLTTKINDCYAKLGDFSKALKSLKEKCAASSSVSEKEHYLWEIANMQANCMGDYQGARQTLTQLLAMFPFGKRAADAYKKLAEVQCMQKDFNAAAATYAQFLQKFHDDPERDKIIFYSACIAEEVSHNLKEAVGLYSQIIDKYPQGGYYQSAFFRRGDCLARLGRMIEARGDYKKYLAVDPQGPWSSACAQRLENVK